MSKRQHSLRNLAVKLNVSGTAEAIEEQRLYQGSYGFIKLQVYAPITQNTDAPVCTAFCTTTDEWGTEVIGSKNYNLLFAGEFTLDGEGYLLFECYLPKEFTETATVADGLKITFNYYDSAVTTDEDGNEILDENGVPTRHATDLLVSSRYTTTVYPGGWNNEGVELDISSAEAAQINANMQSIAELQTDFAGLRNNIVSEVEEYTDKVAEALKEATEEAAEKASSAAEDASKSAEEAAASAEAAKKSEAAAEEYAQDAGKSAEEAAESAEAAKNVVVVGQETAAEEIAAMLESVAAEAAEKAAEEAAASIDNALNVTGHKTVFVTALPESGDTELLYAVVSDGNSNLFDLYSWTGSEWLYLGAANLFANGQKIYEITIETDAWENGSAVITIEGLESIANAEIVIYPADKSAAEYYTCGITVAQEDGNLVFSCDAEPSVAITVYADVKTKYEIPLMNSYYTVPEVDEMIDSESSARESADKDLQSQITTLKAESGSAIAFKMDSETFIISATLKNAAGETLSTASIDLPLESVVVDASYANGQITLTLQNGKAVSFSVAELIDGLATSAELEAEETARKNADADLQTAIDSESSARESADKDLQSQITTIQSGSYSLRVIGATIETTAWSDSKVTVSVSYVTASNDILIIPTDDSAENYFSFGIAPSSQAEGSVTFTCTSTPTAAISVKIIILN